MVISHQLKVMSSDTLAKVWIAVDKLIRYDW